MLTAADRLVMLEVMYDVRVSLTPDGERLDVTGPAAVVDAVTPMLKRHRTALLAALRQVDAVVGPRGGGELTRTHSSRAAPPDRGQHVGLVKCRRGVMCVSVHPATCAGG